MKEQLNQIKWGKVSVDMFDHIVINAFGEKHAFSDLCQILVKGQNSLIVKVFEDNFKDEILKAIAREDLDMSVSTEGKDIKVKLGTTKKEVLE